MKKRLIFVALLSAVSVLSLTQTSWTQPLPGKPGGQATVAPANRYGPNTALRNALEPGVVDFGFPVATEDEVGRLVGELREADDAKKAELTKQLEAAVAKQFERDMEGRETELTKLDERLNKLRAQLDRRRKAKTDIIQLQVKVLVNEAEGLGFTGQPIQPGNLPRATTRSSSAAAPLPPLPPASRPSR